MLDKQVVRAALKSYRNLFASSKPSANNLPPSSGYLRLLLDPASRPSILANASWRDASSVILLLEWRAALLVREYVQNAENPDANANQRTSKAVSEAFVATQVGEILKNIQQSGLEGKDTVALSNVYLLVRFFALNLHFALTTSLVPTDDSRSGSSGPAVVWRLAISRGQGLDALIAIGYSGCMQRAASRSCWLERCVWVQ